MDYNSRPIYNFYEEYKEKSSFVVFILMIFTIGLYFIWWVYKLNSEFESKNIESPDSKRGLVVLITFPFLLGFFFSFLEWYFEPNAIIKSFQLSVSYFIIVLQLKFLYDFCVTFGNITKTNSLWWYYSMFFWFLAVVLLYFQSYYTMIFMFFPVTAIPAMQAFLNKRAETFKLRQAGDHFNYRVRQEA